MTETKTFIDCLYLEGLVYNNNKIHILVYTRLLIEESVFRIYFVAIIISS